MTDYSLFTNNQGVRTQGPSNGVGGQTRTFGVEFYVTKKVWFKTAALYRNNTAIVGTPTFQLYQVTGPTSGYAIPGGSGVLPSGNYRGWGYGRANPLPLQPYVAYKLAVTVANTVYAETLYSFGSNDVYKNGLNQDNVIIAPPPSGCVSKAQMTYLVGGGYPNVDFVNSNWWIDPTVSDIDPTATIYLGTRGSKGKSGKVDLQLTPTGVKAKRMIKASSTTMHFSAVGYYQYSSSTSGALNLSFSSSVVNIYRHSDEITGTIDIPMGSTALAQKRVGISTYASLKLQTLSLREFYTNTARAVKQAMLQNHWDEENKRFKQGVNVDAESLSATTMGGLFLTAIGDHDRGHLNIRHLRSFRVKNQDVVGLNYEGPRAVMGYKPYAELGTQPHVNPPVVIDQAGSWAAVLFKMRYGEPVGDDVDSLRKWNTTRIVKDPDKSLHGGQFLGFSRAVTSPDLTTVVRPTLAAAAWALLAASDLRGVLSIDPPRLPSARNIIMQGSGLPAEGKYRIAVSWQLAEGDTATYFEAQVERKDSAGKWVNAFPTSQTGTLPSVLVDDRYVVKWTIPAPTSPTSFRVRLRLRNAADGPWSTSFSQAIPADRLALRSFLDEDVSNQGALGGAEWTRSSIWKWLSHES